MKDKVQELAVMTTTDVTAITPVIISAAVEEIARDTYIWGQFYKLNKDLMENGGTQVIFPKKNSGISASWGLTAGQGLTAGGMSFSAVTIAVVKGGVAVGIYGEAIREVNRDVIADCVKEAGIVWGATLDLVAFEAMFDTLAVTACNNGTMVATSVGVLGVKALNPSTITGVTIVNIAGASSICYASDVKGTVTIWKAPSTIGCNTVTAGASSFTARDIGVLTGAVLGRFYHPKVLVVHPERLPDLVYDVSAKLLYPAQYGPGTPVYNGELGQLWGLKIVVNAYASKYAVVAIDPEALGYQVIRKDLSMLEDKYTGASMDALYFWGFGERNFGVVNRYAYGVMCMTGTYTVAAGLGSGFA